MPENLNESQTDVELFNYLTNEKQFSNTWYSKQCRNRYVKNALNKASKKNSGNPGEPDFIYINETKQLLILVENKRSIMFHCSKDGFSNPIGYAIDGIKHYLKFFVNNKDFYNWNIIGIAFSGSITAGLNKKIDTFIIKNDSIENINLFEFLDEEDYVNLFESIDLEKITNDISKSSSKINNQLRSIDSQYRPILLSALMISLLDRESNSFRRLYKQMPSTTIADNIIITVKSVLKMEQIDDNKIDTLINMLSFLKTDINLRDNNKSYLKDILDELKDNVIPLFSKKSNYDIIGKFYEQFLKYAGISNVKKGIVLTPSHITTLFTELITIKTNDVILDPCCGTGSFLIAGMNKIHNLIDDSKLQEKTELKNKVKEFQLLGFESNSTMFTLAISNMLFRGDGKSKIYNIDFFDSKAIEKIKEMHPTVGFMNPPYGGKDNRTNTTKKEIQFLERLLDNVSRYGIMIAPLSVYSKDNEIRNRILSKHTLKYVINMPNDLFQPNAMTHTAISIFETHCPHNNKEVIFYNLSDDGFVLSKSKGRTDRFNKWKEIKQNLILTLLNPQFKGDEITALKRSISEDDEWLLQAYCKTDYSDLSEADFEKSIREYIIFKTKQSLGITDDTIDEIALLEILNSNTISSKSFLEKETQNE